MPTPATYTAAAVTSAVLVGMIEAYQALTNALAENHEEAKQTVQMSSCFFSKQPGQEDNTLLNSFGFASTL
jgi:hypothetical protein